MGPQPEETLGFSCDQETRLEIRVLMSVAKAEPSTSDLKIEGCSFLTDWGIA